MGLGSDQRRGVGINRQGNHGATGGSGRANEEAAGKLVFSPQKRIRQVAPYQCSASVPQRRSAPRRGRPIEIARVGTWPTGSVASRLQFLPVSVKERDFFSPKPEDLS